MNDTTTVTVTVLQAHQEAYEAIDNMANEVNEIPADGDTPALVAFVYHDVGSAALRFEYDLREQKIPYTLAWGACTDVEPGFEHFRLDENGNPVVKIFYADDDKQFSIEEVAKAFEEDCVGALLERKRAYAFVHPWSSQAA
ncbi:hypothetical protein LCGC14_0170850 [marine sediment metagenome]|uniref:Uncharacterized protein n=1 Tax=marine sediment metagenome TaxID=412755 RepID=A0A0F9USR6_9ZZZZ